MRFKRPPICLKIKEQMTISMIAYYPLLFFIFSQCAFAQEPLDNGDVLLWDGLESDSSWSINADGRIALTPDHRTEGNSSLAVNVKGEIPAHGVILKKADANLDVSFANKIILDIYNSGSPCQIALAFDTGNFHESVPKRLNSGLNKNITFEVSPKDFKTSFDYSSIAKNVMFIIYPGDNSVGSVYFDNMRIKKYEGLKFKPPGISPMVPSVVEGVTPPESTSEPGGPYSILNGSSPQNSSSSLSSSSSPSSSSSSLSSSSTVPEHKTFLLFGLGLAGFFFYRKKT
jgi:hypothetical protein